MNNLNEIKANKPQYATHYCLIQKAYIHIDNGYFKSCNGEWIQYDDSFDMDLVEI